MHNFEDFEAMFNHIFDGLRWGLTILGVSKAYREWKKDKTQKKDNQ